MSSEEITDDASGGKDESKDNNPYEPKEKPKLIRVLTVFAYILSVSMAAILLSCYYVFVWDAHPHIGSRIQEEPAAFIVDDRSVDTVSPSTLYRTTTDSSVKFAGEEAKDRLYEPKHKKKAVRVLTVVAYVFFVSLAAIMLSLYYVFLWDETKPTDDIDSSSIEMCSFLRKGIVAERLENPINFTTTSATLSSTTDYDVGDERLPEKFIKRSIFMKKLLHEQHFNDILKDVTDHTRGLS